MHPDRLIQTSGLERREVMPRVSIIIPAFNAATTLTETVRSIQQQTFEDWEAIIVDDGSADDTVQIARSLAACDCRIRVLQQPNGGASAARNTGIDQARGVWLLFLDSDDLILPDHLENLIESLESNPHAGAAFTNWSYLTPDNRRMGKKASHLPETGDLFNGFARTALFAIHACLIRRDLVLQVGNFDTTLRTCEDWDLWQRVARLGTIFVQTKGESAIYRMRPLSLSRDVNSMLHDGQRVIDRGFSADPRVRHPAPAHRNGEQYSDPREVKAYMMCWIAGGMLGLGQDARKILIDNPPEPTVSIEPTYIADSIFEATILARCLAPEDWPRIWPEIEGPIIAFLEELETRVNILKLSTRILRALEALILEAVASPEPLTIGGTHARTVEITAPLADIQIEPTVQRMQLAVTIEGKRLGDLPLPVFNGHVPSPLVADAIAEHYVWEILERYFGKTIYPTLRVARVGDLTQVWRGETLLLESEESPADVRAALHSQVGWTIFLQELWDRPTWTNQCFYDDQKPDVRHSTISPGPEGWVSVEASRELPDIRTDHPTQIVLTLAGSAMGVITVAPKGGTISAQQLRAAFSASTGVGMSRVAVREALLGQSLAGPPLRERLRALADEREPVRTIGPNLVAGHLRTWAEAESGPIYARRDPAPSLTSIARLSQVPAGSAVDFLPVRGERDAQDGWYLPEIIALGCPEPVIVEPTAVEPQPLPQPTQRRPVYKRAMRRVARKVLKTTPRTSPAPIQPVVNEVAPIVQSDKIPVLMYHRIAPTGAKATARYRTTPEAFEAQLAYLREAGYESVTVDDLMTAIESRIPPMGQRVLLTFDDAYYDFAEYAWPLLQRYGFGALLFVVSGCTGKTNAWDSRFGEELELLGWDALRDLRDAGVTIGAHTVTHAPLTGLSPREIAWEAAESRRTIQQQLDIAVDTFAYPYGDRDEIVEHVVGSCGYNLGFTCRQYSLHPHDPPLSLPRIEVEGGHDLPTFIRNLSI